MKTIVVSILFSDAMGALGVHTGARGVTQLERMGDLMRMKNLFSSAVAQEIGCAVRQAGPGGKIISHTIVVLS